MSDKKVLLCINGELTTKFAAYIALRLREFPGYELHALFCCDGGELNGGVQLYHSFLKLGENLTLYIANAKSAGAIAALGASKKKMLPYGSVMFHGAIASLPAKSTINDLNAAVRLATRDDGQLRALISKHLPNITPVEWDEYAAGCWAPTTERLIALGFIGEGDRCDFPAGGCVLITPTLT